MHPNDEKFIKFWKKRSEGGKGQFSLISVLFGVVMAVTTELGSALFPDHRPLTIKSFLGGMLIYAIMGFFLGRWYWSSNEKRYQELLKQKSDGI